MKLFYSQNPLLKDNPEAVVCATNCTGRVPATGLQSEIAAASAEYVEEYADAIRTRDLDLHKISYSCLTRGPLERMVVFNIAVRHDSEPATPYALSNAIREVACFMKDFDVNQISVGVLAPELPWEDQESMLISQFDRWGPDNGELWLYAPVNEKRMEAVNG